MKCTLSPAHRWMMYDWANSAWVTVVLTAFFPVFLREVWCKGEAGTCATTGLVWSTVCTQIAVLVAIPLVGLWADRTKRASSAIIVLAGFGALATFALGFLPSGQATMALLLFTVASIAYFMANALYDGLLPHVATDKESDRVSLLGYGIGYIGGGIALLLGVLVLKQSATLFPWVFGAIGLWWFLFSLPMLGVHQRPDHHQESHRIRDCIRFLFSDRKVLLFLIGFWFYIDGINTIIRFAVDYGSSIGLPASSVLTALLVTQFIGFPAALVMIWLSRTIGSVFTILVGLGFYGLLTVGAFFMTSIEEFYGLAVGIGLVQGGVQALSRSVFSQIVPAAQSGIAFAMYNLVGRLGCFIGPLILALSIHFSGESRLGVLGLSGLFFLGGSLLWLSQRNRGTPNAPVH